MNLNQILYFLQISRDENFTRAAANLALSQPALSLQMANLEKELGFVLFERGREKTQITPKGKEFLKHAVDILDAFTNLENSLKKEQTPQTITIAAGGSICGWVLPGVMRKMRATHKNLGFEIFEGDRNFIQEALLTGRCDFAITTEKINDPRVESLPFCSDRIVPVASPALHKKNITLENITEHPVLLYHSGSAIQKAVDLQLAKCGLQERLDVVAKTTSLNSMIKCVEEGLGVGFVPEVSLGKKMRVLEIKELISERRFFICFRKKRRDVLLAMAEEMAQMAE